MAQPTFDTIKKHCEDHSRISAAVVEDFLIYYAAAQNKLSQIVDQKFARYRQVIRDFPKEWKGLVKTQLIAHQIFKKNGLIHKYLNHSAIKDLLPQERRYLESQAATPWRVSFSQVMERPEEDFFVMLDLFTDEEYLLYSPGMSRELQQHPVTHFNLVSYNGLCWQAYGPINSYMSFDYDDMFYFATELDAHVADDDDVLRLIDRNPLPFTLLLSGSRYPLTVHRDVPLVFNVAVDEEMTIVPEKLQKDFDVKKSGAIWQFKLKDESPLPHAIQLYYDEENKTVLRSTMSDEGFAILGKKMQELGYPFLPISDIRVHPSMVVTMEKVLKTKIVLIPYEKLFEEDTTPEEQKRLDALDQAMKRVIEDLNNGTEPDYAAISRETGTEEEELRNLSAGVKEMMNRLP